jgi:hypothetical protein
MHVVAALFCLAVACASAPAAAPAGRAVQNDELARIPDVPASELAKRIIEAQQPRGSDVTDTFMVVEVNLQSADNARVRAALAVLDAMATSWAVTIGKLANTPTGDCVAAAVRTATFPPSDEVSGFTYPDY